MQWVYDLGAIAGAATVGYGIWQVYEPAGWIWIGAALLAASLSGAKISARGKPE